MWPFRKDSHTRFEKLVSPHLSQLYRLAYQLTGQQDDAEDLVQDLLIKLYPRLDEMSLIDKLGPWMSQILYRLFVDQYRRQKRSPVDYMGDEEIVYETYASEQAGPSETVNSELTRKFLNTALEKLSEEHRTVVLLHDVEGYDLQEISEIIDVPVGTIKSRLNRARTHLREIIRKMDPTFVENVNTGMRLTK